MQTNVDSQRCNDGERKGEKRERVRGGGHDLAAGNISPQRPSVGFLSSTNQHSKATQKHTAHQHEHILDGSLCLSLIMTMTGKKNPVCNNYTIANSNNDSIYNTNSSLLVHKLFFFIIIIIHLF